MYKHFFILFLFINDIGTIIPSGIRMIKHKLESQLLRFEINFPNRRHKGSILQLIYCNIRRLQIMSRISCAVSLFQINSYLISLFNQFFWSSHGLNTYSKGIIVRTSGTLTGRKSTVAVPSEIFFNFIPSKDIVKVPGFALFQFNNSII